MYIHPWKRNTLKANVFRDKCVYDFYIKELI